MSAETAGNLPSSLPGEGPQRVKGVLLGQAVDMLRPLIRLWIANGIGFTEISRALRAGFIDAAQAELEQERRKPTDAAISLLSGVHRKEVKSHRSEFEDGISTQEGGSPSDIHERKGLSYAEQVFTRWATDAAYRSADGMPSSLPFAGPAPSFETLVSSVTKDFSKRTVLDELVRLGLVRELGEQVIPQADAMVPKTGAIDIARYFHDQMRDHLAAGAKNVQAVSRDQKAPFLEHSMYVNGISDPSIDMLSNFARAQWKQVFEASVNAAQQRYELDEPHEHTGRLRFGVYVYSESDARK